MEDALGKRALIMSWLLDESINRESLQDPGAFTQKAIASLRKMNEDTNKNKLRRILDADLNLIKTYVSPQFWNQMQALKKNSSSITYSCCRCHITFMRDSPAWRCARCQMWNHPKCTVARKRTFESDEYSFCDLCYQQ